VSDPLFTKPSRRALFLWATLAAMNLAAGVILSSQPARLADLQTVQGWGQRWLVDGDELYDLNDSPVDYPPNAVVLLSPLGLMPLDVAHPMWMMLNIAMAVLAAYCAARFFRPHDPFRVILLPILMFLSWGGVRTLSQFTLTALMFSMAALWGLTPVQYGGQTSSAPSRANRALYGGQTPADMMSGVWLGLALIKPQVALPVLLWTLFTRRWRAVVIALCVAMALTGTFCLRAGSNPLALAARQAVVMKTFYTGDAILSGASELRPLIAQTISEPSRTDAIAGSVAVVLLAAICAMGIAEGRAKRHALYAAPPLVACWALMTFYHLTYGFVVLLPVMMMLALDQSEPTLLRRRLFWFLQLGMMFDIPGLSRRAGFGDTALYSNVLAHADRVLIVALFVGLIALASQAPTTREFARPETVGPTAVR